MKQSDSFQTFDHEQIMKRRARKRQAKHIRAIPIDETETWLFSTDLDEALDSLAVRLEVTCH